MLKSGAELAPGAYAPSTPATLVQAVENLLRLIATPVTEGPNNSAANGLSWEDEDYSYIESQVDDAGLAICDISIADGKVFIRVLKNELDGESVEGLPRLATIDPLELPNES